MNAYWHGLRQSYELCRANFTFVSLTGLFLIHPGYRQLRVDQLTFKTGNVVFRVYRDMLLAASF